MDGVDPTEVIDGFRSRVRPRRRSLRHIFLRSLAWAQGLPIVILGLGGTVLYVQGEEKQASDRMVEAASSIALQVGGHLEQHQRVIANLTPMVEAVWPDPDPIGDLLERTRRTHSGFLTLLSADRGGTILMGAPPRTPSGAPNWGRSVADRPYFRHPMATGKPFLSNAFLGRGFGSDVIVAVSVPLGDPGRPDGIVEGSLSLAAFDDAIEVFRWLPEVQIAVVDSQGQAVFATENMGIEPLDIVSLAEKGNLLPGTDQEYLGFVSGVASAGDTGWQVLVRWPRRIVHQGTFRFLLLCGLIAVVGLAIAAGLANYSARQATAPFEALVEWSRTLVERTAEQDSVSRSGGVSEETPREVAALTEAFREIYLERLRMEKKMLQAQKLESLGVLSGGIAHDFGNLLLGIQGNLELGLEDLSEDSDARPSIETAMALSVSAGELTHQLMVYAGKGKRMREPCAFGDLVEQMTKLLETSVSKRAILKLDVAPDLPTVLADPSQMRQILMNLIINASDALGEKGGRIRVTVEEQARYFEEASIEFCYRESLGFSPYLVLEVADEGSGMDKATLQRIFDPFFTTKTKGRGLGMAAVLGIVRDHEAAIQVRSEVGVGTLFRLFFPVHRQRRSKGSGAAPGRAVASEKAMSTPSG